MIKSSQTSCGNGDGKGSSPYDLVVYSCTKSTNSSVQLGAAKLEFGASGGVVTEASTMAPVCLICWTGLNVPDAEVPV